MKITVLSISMLFFLASCNGDIPIKPTSKISELPIALNGEWNLQVKNLQNKIITTAIVSFTVKEAKSCIGGNWKKLIVKSYKNNGKDTYPVTEPLSYEFSNNKITIGRNEICDGYLHLSGDLKDSKVLGDYYTFGITGSTNLGFFSLEKSLNK